MMKLAEVLLERKKIKRAIQRFMEYRQALLHKNEEKKTKGEITLLNTEIDRLTKKYLDISDKINAMNLELGLSRKMLEMKFLKLEVSAINKTRNGNIHDLKHLDALESRLETIESRKGKLQFEIQQTNYCTDITEEIKV